MNKLRKIIVQTKNGDRTLIYRPVNDVPKESYICEICPYFNICEFLPDPTNIDDKDRSFMDFCGSIETNVKDDEKELTSELIPVEGTIENNLGDIYDVTKELIKKNALVKVQDIVDNVCSGWCDSYAPDCANCNAQNTGCILNNLFKNTKTSFPPQPIEEEKNGGIEGIGQA